MVKALAVAACACAVVLAVVASGAAATHTAEGVAVKADPQFTCVFLHGFGNLGPNLGPFNPFKPADPVAANTKSDMPLYWGDIKARLKDVCTTTLFYDAETMSRGWTDVGLQQEYCGVIAHFKPHAIFTHSMANQIIAAGIQAKRPGCTNIGPGVDQVNWWGLQGPMRGSPVATMAGKLCPNPIIGATANLVGKLCTKATIYTGWALGNAITSLLPQTCPKQWTDVAAKYMSGNMCGKNPANLDVVIDRPMAVVGKKLDDVALSLGSKITAQWVDDPAWRAGNDGLVSFDSCRIADAAKYKSDPESNFYALNGNHADGTCRNGDAADAKDLSFRACEYIVLSAQKSRNAKAVAGKLETRFVQLHEVSTAEATADAGHVEAVLVEAEADHEAADEAEDETEDEAELEAEAEEEEDEAADQDADAAEQEDAAEADDEADAEAEEEADSEADADADAEDA